MLEYEYMVKYLLMNLMATKHFMIILFYIHMHSVETITNIQIKRKIQIILLIPNPWSFSQSNCMKI